MSISSAPSAAERAASVALTSALCAPVGKPHVTTTLSERVPFRGSWFGETHTEYAPNRCASANSSVTSLAVASPKQQMSRKLRTKKGKADYARRKAIVEPVFGQIKVAQGAHQLRLRGQVKADVEWTFHLACHNFRKLAGSGWTTTQMATN